MYECFMLLMGLCSIGITNILTLAFPVAWQEHHLQRAISAQQVYGEKPEHMVIPVPETQSNVPYYDQLYAGEFKCPKSYIRIQRKVHLLG